MITYEASLDKKAIIITLAITALFAFIIGGQFILITDEGRRTPLYTTVTCLVIYLIAFAFRPIKYAITSREIIVKRPLLDVHINRDSIVSIEPVDEKQLSGAVRTFGVGGLFGYYGRFTNFSIGNMTWYVTHTRNSVLIRTVDNKKIIVSPDDVDSFVVDLVKNSGKTLI